MFRNRLLNNVLMLKQQVILVYIRLTPATVVPMIVYTQMVLGGWEELPQLKKNPLKATILKIKR